MTFIFVICATFFAFYWVGRKISNLPSVWKHVVFGCLAFLGAIGPLELASGWMLDLPLLVPYGLSLLACLALFAAWLGGKVTWIYCGAIGLGLAVGSVAILQISLLWLFLLQGYLLDSEISRGRISPTLTYRIIPSSRLVLSTYNWDPQKHPEYILLRNPQGVRWIHRVEARGPMPCVPEHPGLANWIVRAEPDGHTVSISCDFDPLRRESTPTTKISVP